MEEMIITPAVIAIFWYFLGLLSSKKARSARRGKATSPMWAFFIPKKIVSYEEFWTVEQLVPPTKPHACSIDMKDNTIDVAVARIISPIIILYLVSLFISLKEFFDIKGLWIN